MRPRINIEKEGLEKSLKNHLKFVLEDKGLVSESELWGETLNFFSPNMGNMANSLIKNYKMAYGRRIGQKTAKINLINNLRLILSKIKKNLIHTQKPVIVNGKRYGRIFYAKGYEGQIQKKVKELVKRGGGHQWEVLKGVEKGPVEINPINKRAVELLEYYGLVETKNLGRACAVKPGFEIINYVAQESKELFPNHFKVLKPFSIETWVLKEGPEKIKLKFDLVAWDPVNRIFFVGLKKDYVGINQVKSFREKQILLHLASKAIVFCKDISESAKRFCEKWGIEIRI